MQIASQIRSNINRLTLNRYRILLYHSILDNDDPFACGVAQFRQHMSFLAENSYKVVSLEQAQVMSSSGQSLKKVVCLTFDDGYTDFLENAAPILDDFGFKATVYIVTEKLGGLSDWSWRDKHRPLATFAQIQEIKQYGHDLGSHTLTHPKLPKLTADQLSEELILSRDILKSDFGQDFLSFAYPFGFFGQREQLAVEESKYDCAVAIGGLCGNDVNTNKFSLKRDLMRPSWKVAELKSLLNGVYDWKTLTRDIITRFTPVKSKSTL